MTRWQDDMVTASLERRVQSAVPGTVGHALRNPQWRAAGITIGLVLITLWVPIPLKAAPQERHMTISARSFAFEPGTVHVNRGDKVVINLESTDVVHGLYVDGYGVSTQAEPGQPGQLTFVADRSGAFRFRCNVACGNLHPFMIGKLVVGPNLTWLRAVIATVIMAVGAIVAFWNHRPVASSQRTVF